MARKKALAIVAGGVTVALATTTAGAALLPGPLPGFGPPPPANVVTVAQVVARTQDLAAQAAAAVQGGVFSGDLDASVRGIAEADVLLPDILDTPGPSTIVPEELLQKLDALHDIARAKGEDAAEAALRVKRHLIWLVIRAKGLGPDVAREIAEHIGGSGGPEDLLDGLHDKIGWLVWTVGDKIRDAHDHGNPLEMLGDAKDCAENAVFRLARIVDHLTPFDEILIALIDRVDDLAREIKMHIGDPDNQPDPRAILAEILERIDDFHLHIWPLIEIS